MTRPDAAVVWRDVHKRFGPVVALDGLSFTVGAGNVTALLGPNGAGKTTALELAAGLQAPDRGDVVVLGRDPWRSPATHRARVGIMLQQGGIWSSVTPRQALAHLARFHRHPLPIPGLISRLHLDRVADTPFRRLSGGEQQRTKLASALVGRPELVMLDEPSAGLDPSVRLDVWDLIRELRAGGVAVVLSTHSLQEAEQLADTVVIVSRGRCVASGTAAELTADPGAETLRFTAAARLDRTALLRVLPAGFALTEGEPGRYRLTGGPIGPTTIAAITAWCAEQGVLASELNVQQRDLEQVFLDLTGERQPTA